MRLTWILLLHLIAPFATAQDVYVPESLREWAPWVLEGREYRECPFLFDRAAASENDFVCAWPGVLTLDVGDDGASFELPWTVVSDTQWLALPGNGSHWPLDVRANGRAVSVVDRRGVPSVRMAAGEYVLTGRFEWTVRPAVLRVPAQAGLIRLSVDGDVVEGPERSREGIFLGRRAPLSQDRDAVDARVFRLIMDDVPTRLLTRLRLDVAGSVREETLGPVLPDGFIPLALSSPLPARLEGDGRLRIQVRPGSWTVELAARGPGVVEQLRMPEPGITAAEIWSWSASDRLRVTAIEGVAPVDPQQANVPRDWQQLPAYQVTPGSVFTIVERSRGMVAADNELTLGRRIWLDFDGEGFVVSDRVGGAMRSGWRLDMDPPYVLLSAMVDGDYLQVTEGAGERQTGVELRRRDLGLEALGRIVTRDSMAVTGWDARFAAVTATLDVPPGHLLLAAPGVDRAAGSWTGQWQLLDFFLLLVVTIGTWRLLGTVPGVLAFAALTLSMHEPGAPSWLWLNLLIAMALVRVAPAGGLQRAVRGYQYFSAALTVLVLIPFVVTQLTIAIYPQLERQFGALPPRIESPMAMPTEVARDEVLLQEAMPAGEATLRKGDEPATLQAADTGRAAVAPAAEDGFARYAANEIVQAGPGKPDWQWNRYRLEWSGPVTASQDMRLVILPRWAVGFLRIAAVALLLVYSAVLASEIIGRPVWPGGRGRAATPAAPMLALACAVFFGLNPVAPAAAQTPDPELLRELEQRLLAPPDCAPRCAELAAADVTVSATALSLRLAVHAFEEVAVPLPGNPRGWQPAVVSLSAAGRPGVVTGPDGSLWARVPAGRHTIEATGPLPPGADSVEIAFPTPPRTIDAEASGWLVGGIEDGRLVAGTLTLTRLREDVAAEQAIAWESSRFPPFAAVTRRLRLDLDWSVYTEVRRIAPREGALTLEVPLVPGESVLTEDIVIVDDNVRVSMEPGQQMFAWRSALSRADRLELENGEGMPWQEIWEVGVGRAWHAVFTGIPESESGRQDREARIARFYPRGGERLTIDVRRPLPADGSTLAFDSANLAVDVGQRSRTTTLDLAYRSTRGAQHTLRLPETAEVGEVRIDGRIEPLRADQGELVLPILPGEHRISVRWQTPADIDTVTTTPGVDVGADASNITLTLTLPRDRWLLGTSGPPLGPAVLYWPALAALLLFAAILGRIKLTPLRSRHWLLLGLGFSTFNWAVFGWVVLWLIVCGARERFDAGRPWWQFNAAQALVAVLTITSMLAIVGSLPEGLLGTPDMHVTGNSSHGNTLHWFADRSDGPLPAAAAVSVPLWSYKALILAWALWLSFALLRWLPWAWRCFSRDGYWRPRPASG